MAEKLTTHHQVLFLVVEGVCDLGGDGAHRLGAQPLVVLECLKDHVLPSWYAADETPVYLLVAITKEAPQSVSILFRVDEEHGTEQIHRRLMAVVHS